MYAAMQAAYAEALAATAPVDASHAAPEGGAATAGRAGEAAVSRQLVAEMAALGSLNWLRVYPNVRVHAARGRREIDVVALHSGGASVIEVKNWSGSVALGDSGSWVQLCRGGGEVVHKDPARVLAEKGVLLQALLRETVPGVEVSCQLLLVGEALSRVDPHIRTRCAQAGVELVLWGADSAERDRFSAAYSQSLLRSFAETVVPDILLQRPVLAADAFGALAARLESMPTWDSLTLCGGRRFDGDVVSLGALRQPSRGQTLQFAHSASVASALLWVSMRGASSSVTCFSNSSTELWSMPVAATAVLSFQAAGSDTPTRFTVTAVSTLSFGGDL